MTRPGEPIRILIVDDEAIARRHLSSLLAAETGLELVGECRDGREAVEAIRSIPEPDRLALLQKVVEQVREIRAAMKEGDGGRSDTPPPGTLSSKGNPK